MYRRALEAGICAGGERARGNHQEGQGLSPHELTCRRVLEASSRQDMYLGHLLRVATQRAPAGAGGLIQAQLPDSEQDRKQRGARKTAMSRGFKK